VAILCLADGVTYHLFTMPVKTTPISPFIAAVVAMISFPLNAL